MSFKKSTLDNAKNKKIKLELGELLSYLPDFHYLLVSDSYNLALLFVFAEKNLNKIQFNAKLRKKLFLYFFLGGSYGKKSKKWRHC